MTDVFEEADPYAHSIARRPMVEPSRPTIGVPSETLPQIVRDELVMALIESPECIECIPEDLRAILGEVGSPVVPRKVYGLPEADVFRLSRSLFLPAEFIRFLEELEKKGRAVASGQLIHVWGLDPAHHWRLLAMGVERASSMLIQAQACQFGIFRVAVQTPNEAPPHLRGAVGEPPLLQ